MTSKVLTAAAIVLSIILIIADISNANTWVSGKTGFSVTVPNSVREVTQMGFTSNKEKPYIERTYSFLTTDEAQLVYICEISLKGKTWNKPGYDPLLGRKQNAKHPALIKYDPHNVAVWKAMTPVAKKAMKEADLREGFVENCIFVTKCKVNKKRNVGIWVTMSYKVDGHASDKDIKDAIAAFDKHIIIGE